MEVSTWTTQRAKHASGDDKWVEQVPVPACWKCCLALSLLFCPMRAWRACACVRVRACACPRVCVRWRVGWCLCVSCFVFCCIGLGCCCALGLCVCFCFAVVCCGCGLVWFGLVFGLVWFGLVWFGLVWFRFGLVWFDFVLCRLSLLCGVYPGTWLESRVGLNPVFFFSVSDACFCSGISRCCEAVLCRTRWRR